VSANLEFYEQRQETSTILSGISGKGITRRSGLETCSSIESVLGSGIRKPTHAKYRANLSWIAIRSRIQTLESQVLVLMKKEGAKDDDEPSSRRGYLVTNKGFTIMQQYKLIRPGLLFLKIGFVRMR
jgi:predicted transcriptional regulator